MNNQCIFCTQWAATACCISCRAMDRSTMFAIFLTQLGKASIVDNYYDQIKALCQQMETVSLLLTCIKWYSVLMI